MGALRDADAPLAAEICRLTGCSRTAPELADFARRNPGRDQVIHPGGKAMHPGVLLAVHEEIGEVNIENGFWWVLRRDGAWTRS